MGTPGRGFKGFLQVGREAVWATGVAATRRIPVNVITPAYEKGTIKSSGITGLISRAGIYEGGEVGRFSFEIETTFEGCALLFDWFMGTAAFGSIGGTIVGSNPYTTTYKQREILNSYTLELGMGDTPAGKCEQIVGAKVDQVSLKGSAGLNPADGIVIMRIQGFGKLPTLAATPTGALTAIAPQPILFHQISTDADGTADVTADVNLKSFELTVQNGLALRFALGGKAILEPLRNAFAMVTLKLQNEFQTTAALAAYMAVTQGNPQLVFTSGSKSFTISLPKAYQTAPHQHALTGPGLLEETFTWEAIDDGGSPSSGLTLVTINTESTIT